MAARRIDPHALTTFGAFAELRADYEAAKRTRFRRRLSGVASMGSGGDYHYRSEADYLRIMEAARAIDRNDPVVGQALTRLIDNVLQDGITVDIETGNGRLDGMLMDRWQAWSTDKDECDLTGQRALHALATLVLRSVIVDGDMFVLPTTDGSLELVEAHRCRTPHNTKRNVVHGVLMDDRRRRLEYWMTKDDVSPMAIVSRVGDMKIYQARDADGKSQVLQVYNPKRFTQTRGVSVFAPIMNVIDFHEQLQFSKLIQAMQVAQWGIIIETDPQGNLVPLPARGAQTTETLSGGTTRTIEGAAPGMEIQLAPGQKAVAFSPNIPNPEFFEHMRVVLAIIAVNLGIPLQVLLLDPTQTNFSGWRGAIDQARIGFRALQRLMIDLFYRPVYTWKVRQWLAVEESLRTLAADAGVNVYGHKWNRPRWPYIEPWKDAQADSLRSAKYLASLTRLHAERGDDWDDVLEEIVDDRAKLIEAAIRRATQINGRHPDARLDWREIVNFNGVPATTMLEQGNEKATEDAA